MKKKIISTVLATLSLVLTATPITSNASELDDSSFSNIDSNSYLLRDEYVIEDEAYTLWKEAYRPDRGQLSLNDYSHLITFPADTDEETKQYTYCCMDNIPATVTNYLVNEGWNIEITDGRLQWDDGSYVSGYTDFHEKVIRVSEIQTSYDICSVLTHEIGHVVSLEILVDEIWDAGYIGADSFKNLYFHDDFCTSYICNSGVESKAQFFYEYVYYPFETAALMPELFYIYASNLQ